MVTCQHIFCFITKEALMTYGARTKEWSSFSSEMQRCKVESAQ